jgi:hypothetical protein
MLLGPLELMPADELPSAVGVSCPDEDPNFQDVREPSLALSIQLARDALGLQGCLDDFRLIGVIERVHGHRFIGFHYVVSSLCSRLRGLVRQGADCDLYVVKANFKDQQFGRVVDLYTVALAAVQNEYPSPALR